MLDLERQIRPQESTPVNRDFAPIAYYFDVALWSTRFNQSYRQFFQLVASVDFRHLAVVVGLLLFAVAGLANWFTGKEHRPRTNAACCVTAMGFTLIGLEILLLLAFQAIYGYVYHQLAIVIASFMVGMALGSWRGLRRAPSKAQAAGLAEMQTLTLLQALAALSPLLLYVVFVVVTEIKDPSALSLVSQTLFPALALLCGLLGGYQFPVASRIYFSGSANGMRSPGIVYALDLAGACVGAVVLSAYWVPVFGFLRTALLMAVVNLAPAVLAGLAATGKVAVRP
jgi:spermidine synthase